MTELIEEKTKKERKSKKSNVEKTNKNIKEIKELYDPKIEQIHIIDEKQYYEYTEEEIAYLKLKALYQELKIISIPSSYNTHFYQQNLDNTNSKTQSEVEKELNDFFLTLNVSPNFDLSPFDEMINETDFVKDCFIQVNEILSKLKNRRYLAKFFGDWDEIKKIDLIKMMIKLRNEINNRTGLLLIYESPFNNLYHENFHEASDKKKRMEARKVSKKSKNNTTKDEMFQDQNSDSDQIQEKDLNRKKDRDFEENDIEKDSFDDEFDEE